MHEAVQRGLTASIHQMSLAVSRLSGDCAGAQNTSFSGSDAGY